MLCIHVLVKPLNFTKIAQLQSIKKYKRKLTTLSRLSWQWSGRQFIKIKCTLANYDRNTATSISLIVTNNYAPGLKYWPTQSSSKNLMFISCIFLIIIYFWLSFQLMINYTFLLEAIHFTIIRLSILPTQQQIQLYWKQYILQ